MACLCHTTMSRLQLALPRLSLSASLNASASVSVHAQALLSLSALLSRFGQPAPPWAPDPAWLRLQLPTLALDAQAMATLSAFAQLRADLLALLGIDIAIAGQGHALTQLVASVQARLAAMLRLHADLALGLPGVAGAWMQLSATLTAVARIEAALALGLLPSLPPGPPLSLWRLFLSQLFALLPIIALSAQLNINLAEDIALQLAPMLRTMRLIVLPSLPSASLSLMANLTATLSAVASISASLRIDPLALGLPAVRLMVAARVDAVAAAAMSATGMALPSLLALLERLLPEFAPGLMATPAVVQAAARINAQALAALNWQVPAIGALPVLSIGLPTVAFMAQLKAALGLTASLSPCASGCAMAA